MKTKYLTVAGRLRQELKEISQVVERVQQIWQQYESTQSQERDFLVDAVALNLHSFYAGIERLLEVIADSIDASKPAGSSWHRELLQQMAADIPGVRPAVLSLETRTRLDRYRGFRHVVRNVYSFSLDAEQIGLLVVHLRAVHYQVNQELMQFAVWLEQMARPDS